jgi:hypothetical protein
MEEFLKGVFKDMQDRHRKKEDEIKRLKADMPKSLSVGDRVIVATGLINGDNELMREECLVMNTVNSASKIRWRKIKSRSTFIERLFRIDYWEDWVDNVLIVDVLSGGKLKKRESNGR